MKLFILTDTVPFVSPIEVSGKPVGRITFSVEPWIPAKYVEKIYRHLQKQMLDHHNRPLESRTLKLGMFIVDDLQESLGKTWNEKMLCWNKKYPEWSYDTVWLFYRDIKRADKYLFDKENECYLVRYLQN